MDLKKIGLMTALQDLSDKLIGLQDYIMTGDGMEMFDNIVDYLDDIRKCVKNG